MDDLAGGAQRCWGLLSLVEGADADAAFGRLAARPDVLTCETLRGPWDLLLRFDGRSPADSPLEALAGQLRADPALAAVELLLTRPLGEAAPRTAESGAASPLAVFALARLELAPGQLESVAELVGRLPELERIDAVLEQDELLLLLGGARLLELERVLDRLATLPGVERVTAADLVRLPPIEGDRCACAEQAVSGGALVRELPRLQRALWRYRPGTGELIPLLQATQDRHGYLPAPAIELIAGITGTAASEIYGIVTFYAQFRLAPLGRFLIRQCQGTACHVNGAKDLQGVMEDELGIVLGQTDADGLFTLQKVACLGCCSLAPVVMVNDETHGRLDAGRTRKILKAYRKQAREPQPC